MKFNICLGNIYSPAMGVTDRFMKLATLSDSIRFLRMALAEGGHEVTVSPSYADKDAINIFWERFYHFGEGDDDPPVKLQKAGYRFGIVCTEPVTDGLYNDFEHPTEASSKEVYDHFASAARSAEFVWYLLDEAAPACRALNPNSHHLRHGHIAAYPDLRPPDQRTAMIDFISQGAREPRRERIGEALRQRGHKVVIDDYQPEYLRAGQLEQSRVALSIQKTDNHSIFSLGRVFHAVMNRVPLVLEYNQPPPYLGPYCMVARTDDFIAACEHALTLGPDYVNEVYDRFEREMPMRPIITELIADTFR